MIHVLINTLAEKMNEFLSSYYERAEIIVEAGSIDATPNEDQSDKIILSIVNIERETAMGISAPYRNTKNNIPTNISTMVLEYIYYGCRCFFI